MYVKQNTTQFISEYKKLVGDSLYDIEMNVDDLSQYENNGDQDDLGMTFLNKSSTEIIITNEEKFMAYEVSMLSRYKKHSIIEANNFVKGTIFHEFTHVYFNQVMMEMRLDSMFVSTEYNNFSMIPRNSFGARFIEEGICMYVAIKIGESIIGNNYIPESIEEISNNQNKYSILYRYSAEYVTPFLDSAGIKRGIQIILGNKPPSLDEMLNPAKYYYRIK
jgi:hypothetical protein